MTSAARADAEALLAHGYHPIPVLYKSKRPVQKSWQHQILLPSDLDTHFPDGHQFNLGLLLGTEVADKCFLGAVDIDFENDQELMSRVALAFGTDEVPAKRGAKGITYFGRRSSAFKKKIFTRKDGDLKIGHIEILGAGQQTVIPPSLHPDTGEEYEWVGTPLTETPPLSLPLMSDSVLDEIKLAVEQPASKFFLLNEMRWNGSKGGGDVHDSVLVAVATMVQRGKVWTDDAITHRVMRAILRMLAVCPLANEWSERAFEDDLRRMVQGARDKAFDTDKGGGGSQTRAGRRIDALSNYVMTIGGWDSTCLMDGVFRVYADGWWREMSRHDLARRLLSDPDTASWAEAVDAHAMADTIMARAPEWSGEPRDKVATDSGTVDLLTGEVGAWNREDGLTYCLPFQYDAQATCPAYDKFVQETFRAPRRGLEDQAAAVATFDEYAGLSFVRDVTFQRALVVSGPPGSGKSTLLNILTSTHAAASTAPLDLFDLRNERTVAALMGKLLAVTPEITTEELVPSDVLKMLVDGGLMGVRKLYAERQVVTMSVRLLIACNELFRVRDSSGAVARRLMHLESRPQLLPGEKDLNLLSKLKTERAGMFNRWAAALRRLRERGDFQPPSYSDERNEDMATASDPVLHWVTERTHEGAMMSDPSYRWEPPHGSPGYTSSADLYLDFAEWARMNGHRTMTNITWGTRLAHRFPVVVVRLGSGKSVRARALHLMERGDAKF